jgi:hypothetical protein
VHEHIGAGKPVPPSIFATIHRTPSLNRTLAFAQHGDANNAVPYDLGMLAREGPPDEGPPREDGVGEWRGYGDVTLRKDTAGLEEARAGGFKIRVRRDSTAVFKAAVATQTKAVCMCVRVACG